MSEDCSNTPRKASTSKDTSIETVGIDDGPFILPRNRQDLHRNYAPLVAVHLKGSHIVGAQIGRIRVDGLDGTEEALRLVGKLPKGPIFLSSVTFGGFNFIDPRALHAQRKVPVIVITGSKPSVRRMKRALIHHFPDWQKRWRVISTLGPLRSVKTVPDEPPLYYEPIGCSARTAAVLLRKVSFVSRMPEPLRVAGLIARGLVPASTVPETPP